LVVYRKKTNFFAAVSQNSVLKHCSPSKRRNPLSLILNALLIKTSQAGDSSKSKRLWQVTQLSK
jgi:hypothetical protein